MYTVRNIERNQSHQFESIDECYNFIKKEVYSMVKELYENNQIDKYAREDILYNLDINIREQNGFSHPDLVNDSWVIEGNHN